MIQLEKCLWVNKTKLYDRIKLDNVANRKTARWKLGKPLVTQTHIISNTTDHLCFLYKHIMLSVGPEKLLLTNERPSRPSIHLSGVCVYSIITQSLGKLLISSCFEHQSSGLKTREIIVVFTKQKRINKEGRERQHKEEESCQESAEKQIREYLVPPGKEILQYIYVSTVCFIECDFNISLWPFFYLSFFFPKESIFFPKTVCLLPRHLLCSGLKLQLGVEYTGTNPQCAMEETGKAFEKSERRKKENPGEEWIGDWTERDMVL